MHSSNKYWFCHEVNKKNDPQVYLEECKYKINKKKKVKFIDDELDLNDYDDLDDSDGSE